MWSYVSRLILVKVFQLSACLALIATLNSTTLAGPAGEDYTVGPGDVLRITIADAPELGGAYRVTQSGDVTLTGLPKPINVAGRTTASIAGEIAQELRKADLLVSPLVTVAVEQYNSRSVTVVGAVNKPAVYPLQRPTTLVEVISLAGGLLPNAGETLTVVRRHNSDSNASTSRLSFELPKLMRGESPDLSATAEAGDVLDVSFAPVVYVIGAVTKPGGFVRPTPNSKVSILQVLALAEGMKPTAASDRALIIRQSASAERKEIPINLKHLLKAKSDDQILQANDILFIPESSAKKNLQTVGALAAQTVSGVTIYGLGYRVAGLR